MSERNGRKDLKRKKKLHSFSAANETAFSVNRHHELIKVRQHACVCVCVSVGNHEMSLHSDANDQH